jgi:hypothetical protein
MDDMSLEERTKMDDSEKARATGGDTNQAEQLLAQKRKK